MAEKMKNTKKMNPFFWFLFTVVIPVVIVLTLLIVILNIAGIDALHWVKEKGNDIPVISQLVTTEEESNEEAKTAHLQETIDSKNQEIDQLTRTITDLETVVQDLEQEVLRLEKSQEEESDINEANQTEQIEKSIQTVAKSYEEMDSKQAARILESMEDRSSVVTILQQVSNDTRGEILESMTPEVAADLTQRLMN